jgi:tRNA(Ile2) C34 agmatinyltransferase TiaS
MPFQAIEMGVLAAGRKDMQNGLTEILDSMKFDTPVCPECNEKMENRGRNKKKF